MAFVRYSKYLLPLQIVFDVVVLVFFFFLFLLKQYEEFHYPIDLKKALEGHYKALGLILFCWFLIAHFSSLYRIQRFYGLLDIIKVILTQVFLLLVIILAISGIKTSDLYSIKNSILFISSLLFALLSERTILFFYLKYLRRKGGNSRNIIILDSNKNTDKFKKLLERRKDFGFHLIHHFQSFEELELIDNWLNYFTQHRVSSLFISLNGKIPEQKIHEVICQAEILHLDYYFIPSPYNTFGYAYEQSYMDTFPILTVKKNPLDYVFNRLIKRAFDLTFSLLVIIFFLSWIFPIISLIIYLDSKGPILFMQRRNGRKGKVFKCLKFRTMRPNELHDVKATVRGDSRITKFGKFLRRTSLDELPQFFNVLVGDMSIVGPRPHMIKQDNKYLYQIKRYNFRYSVKPGITGLAQVKGFRGEINSNKDMELRVMADTYYIKKWSLLTDIMIIYLTFWKLIKGDKNAI